MPVPGNSDTSKINSNAGTVYIPGGTRWTLRAIATKSGMTDSSVSTSGVYDNTNPIVAPIPGVEAPGSKRRGRILIFNI